MRSAGSSGPNVRADPFGRHSSRPSALGLAAVWSLSPWLLAVAALTAFVLLGLRSAGAPPDAWLALLESPRFLAWKALTYVRLLGGFDPRRWERAQR